MKTRQSVAFSYAMAMTIVMFPHIAWAQQYRPIEGLSPTQMIICLIACLILFIVGAGMLHLLKWIWKKLLGRLVKTTHESKE